MHVAAVEKVRVCDDLSAAFTLRRRDLSCGWCPALRARLADAAQPHGNAKYNCGRCGIMLRFWNLNVAAAADCLPDSPCCRTSLTTAYQLD